MGIGPEVALHTRQLIEDGAADVFLHVDDFIGDGLGAAVVADVDDRPWEQLLRVTAKADQPGQRRVNKYSVGSVVPRYWPRLIIVAICAATLSISIMSGVAVRTG